MPSMKWSYTMHNTPAYGIMGKGEMLRGHIRAFTVPLSLARLLLSLAMFYPRRVHSRNFCRHTYTSQLLTHLFFPLPYPCLWEATDWQPEEYSDKQVVFLYAGEKEEEKGLSLAQQRKAQLQAGHWRPSLGRKSSESWGYLSRGLNEVRMGSHTEIRDEDILGRRNSKHEGLEPRRP